MTDKIHYEQHRMAVKTEEIIDLLTKNKDSLPVIVAASGIAYSIKRVSVTQVQSEFSNKVEPAIRFHI